MGSVAKRCVGVFPSPPQSAPRGRGCSRAGCLGKGLKGGSTSCRAAEGRLSGLGRLSLCAVAAMKAISAPRTVGSTQRTELSGALGPFATLGCPILLRHPYLPKGRRGAWCPWPKGLGDDVALTCSSESGGGHLAIGARQWAAKHAACSCPISPTAKTLPPVAGAPMGGRGAAACSCPILLQRKHCRSAAGCQWVSRGVPMGFKGSYGR